MGESVNEETTIDVSMCPGPTGAPIPLLHFDNAFGSGKLAVSLADGRALITTPTHPFDLAAPAVMLNRGDRLELGRRLLGTDPTSLDALLINEIERWMQSDAEHMQYHHGSAQGVARAIAAQRGLTFTEAWETGLDGYQRRIVVGDV